LTAALIKAEEACSYEENNRRENYGEESVGKYWARAAKIAEEVFI
jgi:hypothetical protein